MNIELKRGRETKRGIETVTDIQRQRRIRRGRDDRDRSKHTYRERQGQSFKPVLYMLRGGVDTIRAA